MEAEDTGVSRFLTWWHGRRIAEVTSFIDSLLMGITNHRFSSWQALSYSYFNIRGLICQLGLGERSEGNMLCSDGFRSFMI